MPVNYLCSRDLLMMMMFLVASLLVYVRMRRRGDSFAGWAVALGLYALSLLSKQNGVVAPALIALVEWLIVRRHVRDVLWRPLVFAVVPAGYFVWTIVFLEFSDLDKLAPEAFTARDYTLTMAKVHVFYYVRNVVWPFAMRPRPLIAPATSLADPAVLIGGTFIVATLAVAVWWRKRAPVAAFGILAYWFLFAPTSSFRPFRSPATDYRQYPSLAFLCLLVALGLALIPRRRLRAAILAGLVVLAGAATFGHTNRVWRTEESLWAQSVRFGGTALAHLNYGRSVQARDPALSEHHYRIALQRTPDHVYTHINLGVLLVGQGRVDEGLRHARHAVAAAP
ncbi:MAG: hypothetical protein GWO02_05780, partial [Gammaproteobacteria bacterium]|nr:hypothetical protein [Gammaproteobacteria bacterium]